MVCVGCGGGERSFRGLLELGAEGGGSTQSTGGIE